ncbi:MAG TPA: hypothetical protein VGV10_06290, partial [Thermoleophilaceae bacterium]|nr:hypothetical protein [Thermoleophilaceae bacterium]
MSGVDTDGRAAAPSAVRIAAARRDAGLTQRDLADRLDVSLWDIERLEAGDGSRLPDLAEAEVALGLSDVPTRAGLSAERSGAEQSQPLGSSRPQDPWRRAAHWLRHTPRNEVTKRLGLSLREVERLERHLRPSSEENPPAAEKAASPPANQTRDPLAQAIVLGAVASLVLVRFFTEVVGVLPRALNFVDVPIFGLLLLAAAARHVSAAEGREAARYVPPALLFVAICALATIANPSRVEPGPVLVFIYGFAAPMGVYWSAYRLWPTGQALNMSRLVVALGLAQVVVVVLIDLPRFISTNNPDEVSGTFGTNAYQLVFFLLVFAAVLAGIFTFEQGRRV